MSVFSVISNGFQLDYRFYKCQEKVGIEPVPRRILGTYFLVSGAVLTVSGISEHRTKLHIFQVLYSLCLKAMLSKSLISSPSYQIMALLAIFDICSLFVNSLVTGFFGYFGLTYCDFPLFVFICGAHAFGCWLGCSMSCVTLAICRISELNPKLKLDVFFQGTPMKCILGYILFTVAYGTLFTKPVIFRLEFMSWFFDPGVGQPSELYTNMYHTINNISMALLTSLLYTIICYSMFRKKNSMTSNQLSTSQRQFCYQAVVICIAHSISSSVYVYMQFFYTPTWLIAVEQIGWQMVTGRVVVQFRPA